MDTVRGTVGDKGAKAVWIGWDHSHSRGFVPVQLMSLFPADRQDGQTAAMPLGGRYQSSTNAGSRMVAHGRRLELHDLLRGGARERKVGHWRRTLARKVRACVRCAVPFSGKICVCCPMVGLDFGLTFGMGGPMSFLIKRIWIPKNPLPCPKRDAGLLGYPVRHHPFRCITLPR